MAEEKETRTEQEQKTGTSSVDKLLTMLDDSKKNAVAEFIGKVGKESQVFKVTGALVDSFIADIDTVLSAQMDEILHHDEFKEVESTWRGLLFLVQNTEFSKPVKFELLDVTKEELYDDLNEAANGEGYEKDSGLWHHIYWGAYDKVGGHSYTAIVGDFQVDNSAQDISLLQHLSVLSESAQIPFIGNAGHKFFGEESFGDVMNNRFLAEQVNDGAEYTAWRAFRDDDRSKYIGLALPKFLGRLPYSAESEPTKNFSYTEGIYREGKDNSLWCNASFALASNMVRSFENWGWSVKIVGVDSGGKVENLPVPTYEEHGQKKLKVPIEASVGQAKDQELCDLGFIPLAHWDRTDYACFFEVPSTNRPKQIKNDAEATANYAVGARLQYTMLVTRIAHYLKYRQLTFVGKNAGAGDIEKDLKKWLDTLVADFPNAPESVIAERPLRSYQLHVEELAEKPGFFQISAEFRPHVAITGMDVNLKLIAFHSGEEA
ncbi:MAG: type VI secretion system contractile sheath large subunit [Ignavibacteriaceae bacterium]|jgi:type VI secretion system protein ImpC|nr:type VI secretion system contractile sheath large subunit [Ignavibacteriaceae bacterium]MCW9065264.1 type VI secretion system contractile sheath large subunit [Ignavibacteriaceae bacterium]